MAHSWLSLLPPIIVVLTVLLTHKLNISLFIGIISAALLASNGNMMQASSLALKRTIDHLSDWDNLYLYLFLIFIGSIVTLLTKTGSAEGCAQIVNKKVTTKTGVETSCASLSLLLGIDDYLSILTVGYVISPLANRLSVARTKIAFLVHSLAGSFAILVPISSWAAAILSQLDNAGFSLDTSEGKIIADPFYVYLKTIPYMFYSLFIIASVWFIIRKKITFGAMQQEEKLKNTEIEKSYYSPKTKHSILELIMPITLLLGGVLFGMLYTGNYYLFNGTQSFIGAFRYNTHTFLVMCITGLITFIASCILALKKGFIKVKAIIPTMIEGTILMHNAVLMIVLASILGSFLRNDLMTGSYLAHLLLGSIPLFLLPVMIFFTSLIVTLATGSAWGTFALLLPIITQMIISMLQLTPPVALGSITLLFPALGAIFSGAVCGDHISPFSETTMMSATSTNTEPLLHAKTQFPYTIPAIIGTIIALLLSGILMNYDGKIIIGTSIIIGLSVSLTLLALLNENNSQIRK